MRLGDTVFTVGAPNGIDYRGTITRGIISGKDRMVAVNLPNHGDFIMNVMQTDAAINPGNSGGPLVNLRGEVIGINSLKLVQAEIEGMGFAIPIDDAMFYIRTLEKGEPIVRPLLGVNLVNSNETNLLNQAGIIPNSNNPAGIFVTAVNDSLPAGRSGLQRGDVITKINNTPVRSRAIFRYQLYKHTVGDTIQITFSRDGETKTIDVYLDTAME